MKCSICGAVMKHTCSGDVCYWVCDCGNVVD